MSILERLTYISLIALCLLSGGLIVKARLRSRHVQLSKEADPAQHLLGKSLNLSGPNWRQSKVNVVLFLSSTCHFCEASVPFYSRLLSEHQQGESRITPVFAISAEPREVLGQHFKVEHLDFDQIYQIPTPNDLLRGTPTLMIVDNHGIILRAVMGQVPTSREDDFLQIVRTGRRSD